MFRFRVACVNKAGKGPYSNLSAPVTVGTAVKTVPSEPTVSTPPLKPAPKVTSPTPLTPPTSSPASPASEPSSKTPPFIVTKTQSPVNVVTPMTQAPPTSVPAPPTIVTPPPRPPSPLYRPAPRPRRRCPSRRRCCRRPASAPSPTGPAPPEEPPPDGPHPPPRSGRAYRRNPTLFWKRRPGRFGVIRECRENSTGKIFMAKIVPYNPENKQEVLREYEILKTLHNDKIMSLHEAYVTPRYLCWFRYSEDDVVSYLVQILQGVEYLHSRRVIHLDLKPENLLITNLNIIKIVDFGSARTSTLSAQASGHKAGNAALHG
ncbi:hypothetical protein WMY93_034214 [Mugilogobius chulae]|uniref:Protein kinase domain-containing protein n=1 Tax=Mugilogobius chulae TaxID=88201 RepID=A0AAW0MGL0_9GOBI